MNRGESTIAALPNRGAGGSFVAIPRTHPADGRPRMAGDRPDAGPRAAFHLSRDGTHMALARFLQIADLHLGRPFAWLPPVRREQRRRDQQSALEQIVKHAIERDVHAILVPGDLFDGVPVDTGSLTFAVRAFSVPGCPPVFIAPGNHDPASTDNAA